jgi:uncharacterized membrane protein YoaK (UPF0700 family)
MNAFLDDVRQTVAPPRGATDGLLPPHLVGLTAVTGLVDAFSYLLLGHVFVANMTGNVVFFAFALAGAGGFSVLASLVAITCFALGALAAGRLGRDISVAAMGVGALVGALLVLHAPIVFPLVIALVILVAVAVTEVARSRDRKAPSQTAV